MHFFVLAFIVQTTPANMSKHGFSNLILVVGITAAAGYAYFTSFTGKLKFGKFSISIEGLSLSGVTVNITVPITNGNAQSVTISKFLGQLWYGPVKVADLDQRAPITILASGTTNYVIEAKITFSTLISDIKTDFVTGNYLQNFYLKGNLTVGSLTVPIDEMLTALV